MDSAPATSKRPFQGPGVSAKFRGTARAQRECESRFPLSGSDERTSRKLTKSWKTLYISDMQGFFLYSPTPVGAKGSKYFTP